MEVKNKRRKTTDLVMGRISKFSAHLVPSCAAQSGRSHLHMGPAWSAPSPTCGGRLHRIHRNRRRVLYAMPRCRSRPTENVGQL
jgi:hypothetical protein